MQRGRSPRSVGRSLLPPIVAVAIVALLVTAIPVASDRLQIPLGRVSLDVEPVGAAAPTAAPASDDPSGLIPSAPDEADLASPTTQRLVIDYRIVIDSPDSALADAPAVIASVLEDPRGWQQADIDFRLDPAAEMTIILTEGDRAQELCQPYDVGGQFSCQNGPLVVLNAIRWRESVPHWPGDVDSYRTMLVNHEVGHLIGMHHLRCGGDGLVAPVMEQQSGTLRGCQANPWPTAIELRLAATHQFVIAPAPLDVAFPQ